MSVLYQYDNPSKLIKNSYNIALAYLNSKFENSTFLVANKINPESMAVNITASLLCKDHSGKPELANSLNKFINDIFDEKDYEFYLIKIIRERVDETISSEMLK